MATTEWDGYIACEVFIGVFDMDGKYTVRFERGRDLRMAAYVDKFTTKVLPNPESLRGSSASLVVPEYPYSEREAVMGWLRVIVVDELPGSWLVYVPPEEAETFNGQLYFVVDAHRIRNNGL